ncbi:recombinase RecT [Acetivibrio straminisolvens]|jgi:recombination protein RecT|uniref:recombinase RecT n=1 Tax=Acetivibrio straminisolvens TaxID=253314 RepID=UPI00223EA8D1|nr:RecT family recombinase [Acetivibrio straminisolvens]
MANELALIKKDVVDVVGKKVQEFVSRGELHLPPNYSVENAMKSAWLILQNTVDKDKKPVLQNCTKDSIANALLDMAVQGLNPAKKQGYFIAYGRQLVFQRSYFGTMAVTKRAAGAKDIFAEVVYKGDEFEYTIKNGNKYITKHIQRIENVDPNNIVAAYCTIVFDDDRQFTDIMTWAEIQKAWSKSKMNPEKEGSTHKDFAQEMARKTVINRACKRYLNSSDDGSLLMYHVHRADEVAAEAEVEAEIEENANQELIDVDYEVMDEEPEVEEKATEEPKERKPEEPKQERKQEGKQKTMFEEGSGF